MGGYDVAFVEYDEVISSGKFGSGGHAAGFFFLSYIGFPVTMKALAFLCNGWHHCAHYGSRVDSKRFPLPGDRNHVNPAVIRPLSATLAFRLAQGRAQEKQLAVP